MRSRLAQHGEIMRTNTDHAVKRSVSAGKKRCGALQSGILHCREAGQRGSPQIIWRMSVNGKTMGVSDVAGAVQKAGYRTSSPSFRTIVNQALIASGKFKRVGRGQYTAK